MVKLEENILNKINYIRMKLNKYNYINNQYYRNKSYLYSNQWQKGVWCYYVQMHT